jgi:hypothetical protein
MGRPRIWRWSHVDRAGHTWISPTKVLAHAARRIRCRITAGSCVSPLSLRSTTYSVATRPKSSMTAAASVDTAPRVFTRRRRRQL